MNRIAPGDAIITVMIVGADNGKPAPDPVREQDQPEYAAWITARQARGKDAASVAIRTP